MTTKFTPGPWDTLAGDWDKDFGGYCRYTIKPLKELNAGDANLIAAAPEMYAKLDKLAKWLEDLAHRSETSAATCRHESLTEAYRFDAENYSATAADIRKLLAKADGVLA